MVNDTPAASDDRSNDTWRDVASPQAQADLDELLSAALGAAMEHLEKNGEFYPFAMSVDGEPTVDADGEPTAASSGVKAPDVDIVFADPAALVVPEVLHVDAAPLAGTPPLTRTPVSTTLHPTADEHRERVAHAVKRIVAGDVGKVVLARSVDIVLASAFFIVIAP